MKHLLTGLLLYHLSLNTPPMVGRVTGLYRHAVKGLSADALETVVLGTSETFPDDRKFALLKLNKEGFDPENPEWLHKQNFLCAFSAPELMAKYRASYSQQQLRLYERETEELILGPIDLSKSTGRKALADLYSKQSGVPLSCVTTAIKPHQFGNTSSGWKQRNDSRTVHIVNEATVRELSAAIGTPLNPTRFRPNIVLNGMPAWSEFDWIGKTIQCGSTSLQVISRTVRCEGISIDPLEFPENILDVPKLLTKHFPQNGPYLGVYAVVEEGGHISLGDSVTPPLL